VLLDVPGVNDLDYLSLVDLDAPMVEGLVGWWLVLPGRWGGTRWYDVLRGQAATLTNMASPYTTTSGMSATTRPGGRGQMNLDGTDDYLAVSSSALYAPTPLTVAFSVQYRNAPAQYDSPIGKTNGGIWSQGWGFYPSTSTEMHFFVNAYGVFAAATGLTLTTWTRLLGTWDGTTLKIFANGVQGTNGTTGAALVTSNPLEFGRLGGDSFNCAGALDDIKIWKRDATPAFAQQDYAESQRGNPHLLRRLRVPVVGVTAAFPGGDEGALWYLPVEAA
jgi:concanavalin A-like lectin/glucanase superfamily protein